MRRSQYRGGFSIISWKPPYRAGHCEGDRKPPPPCCGLWESRKMRADGKTTSLIRCDERDKRWYKYRCDERGETIREHVSSAIGRSRHSGTSPRSSCNTFLRSCSRHAMAIIFASSYLMNRPAPPIRDCILRRAMEIAEIRASDAEDDSGAEEAQIRVSTEIRESEEIFSFFRNVSVLPHTSHVGRSRDGATASSRVHERGFLVANTIWLKWEVKYAGIWRSE